MFIALEGSSPTTAGSNNYKYYIWQAFTETSASVGIYEPGPAAISMTGSPINIRKMADAATAFIARNSGKIALIGWSRGAAACIQVAHDLKRGKSRQVDAMFLFDAVDQDTSTSSDLNFIPSNVVNCYHAIAIKKSWLDRRLFPTCGRLASPGVNFVTKEFSTSHGGIAGAGDEGDAGSRDWMWAHLRAEGLL